MDKYFPTCDGCRDNILNQEAHYGYGGCLYIEEEERKLDKTVIIDSDNEDIEPDNTSNMFNHEAPRSYSPFPQTPPITKRQSLPPKMNSLKKYSSSKIPLFAPMNLKAMNTIKNDKNETNDDAEELRKLNAELFELNQQTLTIIGKINQIVSKMAKKSSTSSKMNKNE